MTTTQEKIKKTSRYISIGVKIVEVFVIVGAVLSALGLLTILCNRTDLTGFFVDMGQSPNPEAAAVLMPILIGLLIVTMIVDAIGCDQLYRIFKDISREATPFAAKHVRRIKTVAWLTLPLAFLDATCRNLADAFQAGDPAINLELNLMWVAFGAIIYCLAYIFDYGCKLQQESDETL